jgi:hypothetical protein
MIDVCTRLRGWGARNQAKEAIQVFHSSHYSILTPFDPI